MKKEDLKKLLEEGRVDFSRAKSKFELLIFIIVLTCDSYPQVPINGFCKYQVFQVDSGYQKFTPLNYNDDSYTDLFFYNSAGNHLISLDGSQNGEFGAKHNNILSANFSDVQYLWDKKNRIYAYGFISRKHSSAGVFKLSSEGVPVIESQLKFNSYPASLSTGDINGDSIPELLISGSSFNGISIIYQERKLREKKIIEKSAYSEAVFADLNNDYYQDIAAFELFTNKLQFFYNNSQGNFNKVREINFSVPINSLESTDLNLDSYADLIYTHSNSIGIIYGDFTSSYSDSVKITTLYSVDKLITGDFNRDGKIDIAYINKAHGTLSLLFAEDGRRFFPELVYIKKNTFSDITPYYSKFINGIAVLSNKGNFYLISNLASISDGVNIVSGAQPTSVSYFDKNNNGINDLCFIDGYNKSLNLITRSSSGIPDSWFSIPLYESENCLVVDNKLPEEKTFYCYTRDQKLIESIKLDFVKNKYSRNTLYTPGVIKDLKIQESTGKLYAAFTKSKTLGVAVFTNDNGLYRNFTISDISKNVTDAALYVFNKPEVFYATYDNKIRIGERILDDVHNNTEFETGYTNGYHTTLFAGNFLHNGNSALLGFLSSETSNNVFFFLRRNNLIQSGGSGRHSDLRIKDKNQLFFGELRFSGPGRICYFSPLTHSINTIELSAGNKKVIISLFIDRVNSRSFFIKNMNSRFFHLVYIDDAEDCITIREIQ